MLRSGSFKLSLEPLPPLQNLNQQRQALTLGCDGCDVQPGAGRLRLQEFHSTVMPRVLYIEQLYNYNQLS